MHTYIPTIHHLRTLEDPRAVSRHSIPSVLVALLSCQLAVHLYSTMVQSQGGSLADEFLRGGSGGKGGGGAAVPPRFTVMRDRPSVVIPKLCGVSRALDQAIETIIVNFYESDFHSFSFAPLYARCLKMYVECLREREVDADEGRGRGGTLDASSPLQTGTSSPSSIRGR